jgi:NAD(P)H-nitrite reductase large subunit
MREKLVLIGNSMAGMRTIEELLDIAPYLYSPWQLRSFVSGG